MHRVRTLGLLATGLGVVGYAAGVAVSYPGRAFALTLGMVGVALVALGGELP